LGFDFRFDRMPLSFPFLCPRESQELVFNLKTNQSRILPYQMMFTFENNPQLTGRVAESKFLQNQRPSEGTFTGEKEPASSKSHRNKK
jgi:hypothetical protein